MHTILQTPHQIQLQNQVLNAYYDALHRFKILSLETISKILPFHQRFFYRLSSLTKLCLVLLAAAALTFLVRRFDAPLLHYRPVHASNAIDMSRAASAINSAPSPSLIRFKSKSSEDSDAMALRDRYRSQQKDKKQTRPETQHVKVPQPPVSPTIPKNGSSEYASLIAAMLNNPPLNNLKSPIYPEDYIFSQPFPSSNESTCAYRSSQALIDRWRAAAAPYCATSSHHTLQGARPVLRAAAKESLKTSMTCYRLNEGVVENICDVRNFVMNAEAVNQKSIDWDFFLEPGSLHGSCTLNENTWKSGSFGHAAQEWLYRGFNGYPDETPTCDVWVEHDVLFLLRWDVTNLFHFHEDAFQTFSSMAVAKMDPRITETIIVDGRQSPPVGDKTKGDPYHLFWERIFTGDVVREHIRETTPFYQGPIGTYKQPQTRDVRMISKHYASQGKKNICFRRGVFGPHAGISPLSRNIGQATQCSPDESALFLGFRDFVLERLGIQADPVLPESPVRIVFSSRRGHRRAIPNEKPFLTKVMMKACESWDAIAMGGTEGGGRGVGGRGGKGESDGHAHVGDVCGITFDVVDFGGVSSLEEQIRIAHDADILVGAHGAALTLVLYQPYVKTQSALIEILAPERYGNYHFENMANKMGVLYSGLNVGSEALTELEMETLSARIVDFAIRIKKERRRLNGW